MAPRVLGIVFQKGGSGKTTTAVNLAAAFARRKHPTLLIDLDPHAGATTSLGGDPSTLTHTVRDALLAVDQGAPIPTEAILTAGDDGLKLLPADITLAQMEVLLQSAGAGADLVLRRLVDRLREIAPWDFVILDSPPNLGPLTMNVLMAADELIIPVQAHYLAPVQLSQVFLKLDVIRRRTGKDWARITVVPTMVEAKTSVAAAATEFMARDYRQYLSKSRIRKNTTLVRAQMAGQPIQSYDPRSPGAEDYETLAAEILDARPVTQEVTA